MSQTRRQEACAAAAALPQLDSLICAAQGYEPPEGVGGFDPEGRAPVNVDEHTCLRTIPAAESSAGYPLSYFLTSRDARTGATAGVGTPYAEICTPSPCP